MVLINPVPKSDWENNGGYAGDSGLDILVPANTPCVCAADGTVIYAEAGHTPWWEDTFYGNQGFDPPHSVLIKLDAPIEGEEDTYYFIWYTHLYKVDPSILDQSEIPIKAGAPVGRTGIGNRVPHLHFGVVKDRPQTACMPHQEIANLIWNEGSNEHPRLAHGSKGMAVRNLQRILTLLARKNDMRSLDPLGVDGDFGDNTEKAVRAYQEFKDLPVTGVVDEQTWTMIDNRRQ